MSMQGIRTMKAALVAAIALLTLSGCLSKPELEIVSTKEKAYEVTRLRSRAGGRPWRFRIALRDVETGKDVGRYTVQKCLHKWRKLQPSSTWTFPETTYRYPNGATYSRVDVSSLCQRLGG